MRIEDWLKDNRIRAMIDNMAGVADAIWVVDVKTGDVHIVFDAIIPEREGQTSSLEYELKMLTTCNHPLDIEVLSNIYTAEYLSKMTRSVVHDARGYMFAGKNQALRRIITPQFSEEGEVECVIFTFINRFDVLGRHAMDSMIVDAFSEEYENVILVNLETNRVEMRKIDGFYFTDELQSEYGRVPYEFAWDFFLNDAVHPDDREYVKREAALDLVLEKLKENRTYTINYRVEKNGLHYHQAVFIRMNDEYLIMGFRNVDEIMAKEKAQRAQIECALEAAKNANQAKTVFLNNMSHDIRTPMNAIMGFTNLAIANARNVDKVTDYLKKIQTSSAHLLSLINDVLDMSRIESGRIFFNREETIMPQVVENLRNIVSEDAKSKHLKLAFEQIDVTEDVVMCDVLRMDQMLLNVISNAIKFTPSGGRVNVRVQQLPLTDDGKSIPYTFTIKDTGIGMDKEFIDHIFEPFSRERNSTVSGIQGTGLGMSIVKNLLDINGGTINISSEKGRGTEIEIGIKLLRVSGPTYKKQEKIPKNERADLEGIRILLVEDNMINREIALEILKEKKANTDTANDGSIAVNKLLAADANRYDVVLMDIQMPVMNGYEATKKIRAFEDKKKAGIPIIAMTANAFAEDKKMAIEAGMNDFIAKPVVVDKMMETILSVIESKKDE